MTTSNRWRGMGLGVLCLVQTALVVAALGGIVAPEAQAAAGLAPPADWTHFDMRDALGCVAVVLACCWALGSRRVSKLVLRGETNPPGLAEFLLLRLFGRRSAESALEPTAAIERWRERCRLAIAEGRGLPRRGRWFGADRRFVSGIALAERSARGSESASVLAIALQVAGAFVLPPDLPGFLLAIAWLEEETAKGGAA